MYELSLFSSRMRNIDWRDFELIHGHEKIYVDTYTWQATDIESDFSVNKKNRCHHKMSCNKKKWNKNELERKLTLDIFILMYELSLFSSRMRNIDWRDFELIHGHEKIYVDTYTRTWGWKLLKVDSSKMNKYETCGL
jgi:diphthamide biosynthesis methyltransferase